MDSLLSDVIVVCIMLVCACIANMYYKHSNKYKYSVQRILHRDRVVYTPTVVYPKVVRSYVVHVATDSTGKKIYVHKHNL